MSDVVYSWLKCKILKESTKKMDVEVLLQDKTPATLNVHPTIVGEDETGETFLKVEEIGRKASEKLVYIKLPRPAIEFGHNVTVREQDIKRNI